MKQVKNRSTGDIGELDFDSKEVVFIVVRYDLLTKVTSKSYYKNLKDLNEKWEDVEELKGYWYINEFGTATEITHARENIYDKQRKNFGNYFETEEEAEKTVKKLKAWKRLKDKGFRFDGYDSGHNSNKELCGQAYFKAGNFWFDIKQDLDLLFGGEE